MALDITPKERAEDLIEKSYLACGLYTKCKPVALLVVQEIDAHIVTSTPKDDPYLNLQAHEYWHEVKNEIEKL